MDALEQARAEIDTVDAQLAALFERRMAAVLQVAEYKRAHGLPIYDAAREAAVLEKAAARIQQPALRPYYKDHVQHMMDLAKQYEAAVLGRNRAAYQGVEGAFAHIALKALFPHAEAVSYSTWDEVFEAVASGDADVVTEELGDLLFAAVKVARFAGIDPEQAAHAACEKFIRRFAAMEAAAADSGVPLEQRTLAQMQPLWQQAKQTASADNEGKKSARQ